MPIFVNWLKNLFFIVDAGTSIFKTSSNTIWRFRYHETLSITGNCGMCSLEIEGMDKPIASCLTEIFLIKARENIVEALLNFLSKKFDNKYNKNFFNKLGVEDKNYSFLIKSIIIVNFYIKNYNRKCAQFYYF